MKKILLVPVLFGLILLIFSFKDASGVTSIDKNLTPMIKKEIVDIYDSNHDEMNMSNYVEVVENNDSNFSVSIGSDRNTTRDTNESFVVEVNNADNIESCNYFWKITNEIDDTKLMGRELEFAFPKGESSVMVNVICGEQEANATIKVTAWEYYERKTYHYNAYYGELEYTEREIFDYTGKYLIVDNGTFSKSNFVYDDEGRLIERKRVYYQYPSENKITRFTYNNRGERVVVEHLSLDGKLLHISLFTYNKEGSIVSLKSGSDREHLEEYIYADTEENAMVYEVVEEDSEVNIEGEHVVNSDGKVTYEANDDGYAKTTYEYSYHENGLMKEERYEAISEDDITITIHSYNDKGELLSRERSDKLLANGNECSFRTDYTYNNQGDRASSVDVLLGGECPYLDEVEKRFTYDDDRNIINVYSVLDGDVKNGHITMKVEKFYTNELEEF